jgi:hypothetical protein
MRAYQIESFGNVHGVVLGESPDPQPGTREILVRVRATSLNYRDLMVLKGGGRGPTKEGVVPLSDGAGEVVTLGSGARRFAIGDAVIRWFHPRWYGGRIKVTEYRVIGRVRQRFSIPFFYEPRADAEIRPLPVDDPAALPSTHSSAPSTRAFSAVRSRRITSPTASAPTSTAFWPSTRSSTRKPPLPSPAICRSRKRPRCRAPR